MALQDFVPDISCFVALGPYNCVGNCSVHLNVNRTRRDGKKEDADFTLSDRRVLKIRTGNAGKAHCDTNGGHL